MYQLVAGLDAAGMLQRHLQPMLQRLNAMLGSAHMQAEGTATPGYASSARRAGKY